MEINFWVGTVPVCANLEGQGLGMIQEFFSQFPPCAQEPRLTVHFKDDLTGEVQTDAPFSRRGARQDAHYLQFTDYASPVGYVVRGTREAVVAYVNVNDMSGLAWRQRLQLRQNFNPFYLNAQQRALGALIYGMWHWLMLVVMAQNGSTFVHASCLEKGGRALMLPALGGVGKTSLMYQMVTFGGWKFLADDLTILDADGKVSFNPDPIAVYPYNLVGLREIEKKVMAEESVLGRWQWQVGKLVRGLDGVGRRIGPHKLFGSERVGNTAQLERVVYLQRWSGAGFELRASSPQEIAPRLVSVMLSEIRQFRLEYNIWNSVPQFALLPPLAEVIRGMEAVFRDALARSRISVLLIPQGAIPPQLYAFLSEHLDDA